MEKRRKQAIVIKCLFLAVVLGFVMMFVVGMCRSDARFFSSNQTRIRTDSVDSYTVVDDQGRSAIYREQDEKYKTIQKHRLYAGSSRLFDYILIGKRL